MLSFFLLAALTFPLAGERSIGWDVIVAGALPAKSPVVVDATGEFESAAVSWSAAGESGVTLRASADGRTWTDPVNAAIDQDTSIRSEGQHHSAIVHFGSASRAMELRFDTDVERVICCDG